MPSLIQQQAPVGQTLYAVVTSLSGPNAGYVWNIGTAALEALQAAHQANYGIPLSDAQGLGFYYGTFPPVPAGLYQYIVYVQAGGSPALATDTVAGASPNLTWNGTDFVVDLGLSLPTGAGGAVVVGSSGTPTTFQTLFDRAKRRYGLTTDEEDAVLVHPLLYDRVNECLQRMAEGTSAFEQEFQADLPVGSGIGLSSPIVCSNLLYDIVDGTLRIDYDGSSQWLFEVYLQDDHELRERFGPLEVVGNGTPLYYYVNRGSGAASMFNLFLFPASDRAVTGGVRFRGSVYPPPITGPTDTLWLQKGEERFLIAGIALGMAEAEASRGRKDAPLALWDKRWEEGLDQFYTVVRQNVQGTRRKIHYDCDIYEW